MKLYCLPCKEVHELTTGEVERAVYALQALAADAAVEAARPGVPEDHTPCILDARESSWDPKAYIEWVDAAVEMRRSRQKARYIRPVP